MPLRTIEKALAVSIGLNTIVKVEYNKNVFATVKHVPLTMPSQKRKRRHAVTALGKTRFMFVL